MRWRQEVRATCDWRFGRPGPYLAMRHLGAAMGFRAASPLEDERPPLLFGLRAFEVLEELRVRLYQQHVRRIVESVAVGRQAAV